MRPVIVGGPTAQPPVVVSGPQAGDPTVINATKGRAGLWTGDGPPTDVPGAVTGDEYLDLTTGTIYRLGA